MIAATPDQRPALAKRQRYSARGPDAIFSDCCKRMMICGASPIRGLHLEMGLLRLINAARLAPLEELLGNESGGANSGATRAWHWHGAPHHRQRARHQVLQRQFLAAENAIFFPFAGRHRISGGRCRFRRGKQQLRKKNRNAAKVMARRRWRSESRKSR